MKYLLDTCVISELVAKNPNEQVVEWVDEVDEQLLTLSVITLGEIKRGIEKLPESRRKQRLNEWLAEDLLIRFEQKILSIDTAVMLTWGAMVARMESQGRSMPVIDSLIAAIASHYDLQLVTRNEKDFVGSGVTVVNPWKA
jgi:predicted nucleic acid-binding protein